MNNKSITHPFWLRTTHWVNAVAFMLMTMSGWRIYDASPLFRSFEFPSSITLGGWLGGALLWHFAAMWLFVANGAAYVLINLATGRFRRQMLPLRALDLWTDLTAFIRGHLSHEDITRFNSIQKFAYLVAIGASIIIVLSGLVVFKSVQLPMLRELFGGYDRARTVHFLCMSILVAFFCVHVAAAVSFPRTIAAMVKGS